MENVYCTYFSCPKKDKQVKKVFLCLECRERIYCSEFCRQKDWDEIHYEICMLYSKGSSVLIFNLDQFQDKYVASENNLISSYGVLGTSKLVIDKQSKNTFVLKTV